MKTRVNLVDPLPKRLICGLCKEVLKDPIQTLCGYRSCSECYQRKIEISKVCPFEGEQIAGQRHSYSDKFVNRDVMQLKVYCNFKENGCGWMGLYGDLEAHLKTCGYDYKICDICDKKVLMKDLLEHKEKKCLQRNLICKYCGQKFKAAREKDHQAICTKAPKPCPYKCGKKISKDNLYDHVKSCLNIVKDDGVCPFQIVGCQHKVVDMKYHMENDAHYHAALMISKVESLHEIIDVLNEKITTQNESLDKLKEEMQMKEESGKEKQLVNESNDLIKKYKENIKQYEEGHKIIKEEFQELKQQKDFFNKLDLDSSFLISKVERYDQLFTELCDEYRTFEEEIFKDETFDSGFFESSSKSSNKNQIKSLEKIESEYAILSSAVSDVDLKLQKLSRTTYDGRIVWRIDNIFYKTNQAKLGRDTTLHSPPCYTSRFGYKFCLRLYLNGDGEGKDTHVSLFFVMMQSDMDNLLEWPFSKRVTFRLIHPLESKFSICESFLPDQNSASFKKPEREMNVAAGCPQFIAQKDLKLQNFIIDDSIFIEASVDTSGTDQ